MRTLPLDDLGRGLVVRVPERDAVVVRRRQPVSLRGEGEAAGGGGGGERALAALGVARDDRAAGAVGQSAVGMQRQRVDPGRALGGRDLVERAVRGEGDDASVVSAGDDAVRIGGRHQDPGLGMRRQAGFDAVAVEQEGAVAEGQDQRVLQEVRGRRRGRRPRSARRGWSARCCSSCDSIETEAGAGQWPCGAGIGVGRSQEEGGSDIIARWRSAKIVATKARTPEIAAGITRA